MPVANATDSPQPAKFYRTLGEANKAGINPGPEINSETPKIVVISPKSEATVEKSSFNFKPLNLFVGILFIVVAFLLYRKNSD